MNNATVLRVANGVTHFVNSAHSVIHNLGKQYQSLAANRLTKWGDNLQADEGWKLKGCASPLGGVWEWGCVKSCQQVNKIKYQIVKLRLMLERIAMPQQVRQSILALTKAGAV